MLVLADEPTANLDSVAAKHLMELFRELNQHHGVTLLISTHDERVMRYARRLVRMRDGKVISDEKQVSN
jgi:putative ABC transport system ATP-binding protein